MEEISRDITCRVRTLSYGLGLREIFYRSWFNRLWVVQEVALGRKVVAMCGLKSIPWCQISRLAANIKRTGVVTIVRRVREWNITKWDGIASMGTFDRYRAAREEDRSCNVTTLCMDSRWRKASKPADKVYGMLGLMDDDTRERIAVDYSTDAWKVYRNVSLLMLNKSSGLLMLRITACSKRIPGAPSWCVNLDSEERPSMFSRSVYQAGGPVEPRNNLNADVHHRAISLDESQLTLRGHKVDEVSDVVPNTWPSSLQDEQYGPKSGDALQLQWLGESRAFAQAAFPGSDVLQRPDILEPLGRTLIANLLDDPVEYAPAAENLDQAGYHAMAKLTFSKNRKDFYGAFPEEQILQAHRYNKALHMACNGRKFFCTKERRFGLGPGDVNAGDQIFMFKGAEILFLLRQRPDGKTFSLIGEAYVHYLMDGEGFRCTEAADDDPVDIEVVWVRLRTSELMTEECARDQLCLRPKNQCVVDLIVADLHRMKNTNAKSQRWPLYMYGHKDGTGKLDTLLTYTIP